MTTLPLNPNPVPHQVGRSIVDRPAWPLALDGLLLVAAVLWMVQLVTGFRSPLAPIVVHDGDAGAAVRQAVFSFGGLAAVAWLGLRAPFAAAVRGRGGVLFLLAVVVLSVGWSTLPALTARRSIIMCFGVALLIALGTLPRRPDRFLLQFVVGAGALTAWASIAFRFTLPVACTTIEERPGLAGLTGHPNQLAPIMVIGILLSLGLRPTSGPRRLALRIGQAGMAIALVMAQSMTSLAFLVVGVGLFAALNSGGYRRGALGLVAAVGGVLLLILDPSSVWGSALESAGRDSSLSGRTDLWAIVVEEIGRQPLVGTGFGAFWTEGRGRELVATWNPRQSHQAYFDVMLDLGLLGLLAVLVAIPGGLYVGWLRWKGEPGSRTRSATASMVAFGLAALGFLALGESFLLKMDKFSFFVLLWVVVVLCRHPSPSCASLDESSRGITSA